MSRRVGCLECGKYVSVSDLDSDVYCSALCRTRRTERLENHARAGASRVKQAQEIKARKRQDDLQRIAAKRRRAAARQVLVPTARRERLRHMDVSTLLSMPPAKQKKHWRVLQKFVRKALAEDTSRQVTFYDSREWRELRYAVLKSRGRKCEACGTVDKQIHVDHVKPRSRYPELSLVESNLQILCVDCNLGKGAWDETDWRLKE